MPTGNIFSNPVWNRAVMDARVRATGIRPINWCISSGCCSCVWTHDTCQCKPRCTCQTITVLLAIPSKLCSIFSAHYCVATDLHDSDHITVASSQLHKCHVRSYVCFVLVAVVRDPSNVAHTVRNLRLNIKDINSAPPQPTLARKMLNTAVSSFLPDSFDLNKCEVMTFGNYDLQLSGKYVYVVMVFCLL